MLSATAIIRKNAAWYAVSIIISGLSSFGGIFLTKNNLSTTDFIHFNMQMSGITLFNTVTLGWLVQGMTRFYHLHAHQLTRFRILRVTLATSLCFTVPMFFVWALVEHLTQRLWYPIIFLIANAIYTAFSVTTQAALNAKVYSISEIFRNVLVLLTIGIPFLAGLKVDESYYWCGWIISNLLPTTYLFLVAGKYTNQQHHQSTLSLNEDLAKDINFLAIVKKMLLFGLPLSVWLLISAFVMNADRWYLNVSTIDKSLVANYLAIADIMLRGTLFLFSPLSSAVYPVLARLFDNSEEAEAKKLILKTVKWDMLLMLAAMMGFALSHKIVFQLLKLPPTNNILFLASGLLLILFNSIWSISSMLHKVAELQIKTGLLILGSSCAAICSSIIFYVIVKPISIYLVALCFGSGITLYLVYCIFLFKKLGFKKA